MKRAVPVVVVEQRGLSVLVQWERPDRKGAATLCRTIVPVELLVDGQVELADLRAGIGASIDWAAEYRSRLTPDWVARMLASLGIWTVDDLRANALAAQRAVTRIAVEDLYDMLRRLGSQGG